MAARAALALAALVAILALAGCTEEVAPRAVETVVAAPLVLDVIGEGQLQSAKATPLRVPGQGWSQRQLVWMLPEGSHVEKGDLLARFTTQRGELELTEALIELERNALARAAKRGELVAGKRRVAVDLSQVAVQLAIAQRYANADLSVLARNDVLDAIQDADYLAAKQATLRWQKEQLGEHGQAERAVLDAQRETIQIQASQSRADLEALELRAPHAGVMMLTADWSGDKPTIGSGLRAGSEFGRLPDTSALEVELALPEIQAQGVEVGDAVEVSPLGRPGQQITSKISWIASAAKVMSRESPVRYLTMKAKVPAATARKYGWVPGQRFRARVIMLRDAQALSVPNLAIESRAGKYYVRVRDGGEFVRRQVQLGERGSARSQVVDGLAAGDQVLLVDEGPAVVPDGDGDRPESAASPPSDAASDAAASDSATTDSDRDGGR